MLVKNFKKCCIISTAMGESDEDMLWSGSEEDGNVRREFEEEEGFACEDEDNYTDW
jgi:hypothetical protein